MDNFKIEKLLKTLSGNVNGMLSNLDNFELIKLFYAQLLENVELLSKYITSEDKY